MTPQYVGAVQSLCRVQTQNRESLRLEKPNDLGWRLRQEEKTRPTTGAPGPTEAQLPGARPGDLATRSRAGSEDAGAATQQGTTSRSQRSGRIRQPGSVMAEKSRGPSPPLSSPKVAEAQRALCGAGRQAGVQGTPWTLLSLETLSEVADSHRVSSGHDKPALLGLLPLLSDVSLCQASGSSSLACSFLSISLLTCVPAASFTLLGAQE